MSERVKKAKELESQLDLLQEFDDGLTKLENNIAENVKNEQIENNSNQVFVGADGTEYTQQEWNSPVVRNGPTRGEVENWKKQYGSIYMTPFDDEIYVWRTLQRPEYREIIRDTALTALDREEKFTEKCVLYPYGFSLEKIKESRAGIPSLLAEMIMEKSGFVSQSAPIQL